MIKLRDKTLLNIMPFIKIWIRIHAIAILLLVPTQKEFQPILYP